MKVCLLTSASQWGGTELHTIGLAETLVERGHQVSIVQLGHDLYERVKSQLNGRVNLVQVNTPKSGGDVSFFEWVRILRKLASDVCVFEKGLLDLGSWRLDVAARICFRRYITIEQLNCPLPAKASKRHFRGWLPGLGLWWYQTIVMRHLRSVGPHWIVSVSDAVRRELTENYGFPSRKVITIHNGLDPSKFQPNTEYRHVMRERWGIPQDALVYGAVGRLSRAKNYHVAIELFSQLIAQVSHRDMRVVLIGDGPLSDNLKRMTNEAGLQDRVLFPGFTDRPWEAYPVLDVFVMPSLNEGLPLALLEAMACGCCPIGMGVAGVPEVITDPTVGWLIEPGDRVGFFEAMRAAAMMSPDELREMGQRAKEHVISRFDSRAQFSAHVNLIENGTNTHDTISKLSIASKRGTEP